MAGFIERCVREHHVKLLGILQCTSNVACTPLVHHNASGASDVTSATGALTHQVWQQRDQSSYFQQTVVL